MSERDRQNPYDRSSQQGGGYRGNDHDSPRQANQWQSEDHRQQGGYWQQDGNRDDTSREYRFSGQGNASYDAGYQSDRSDDQRGGSSDYRSGSGWYGGQDRGGYENRQEQYGRGRYGREESDRSGYGQGRYGRDPYESGRYGRGYQDRDQNESYGRGQRGTPYAGRNYDASGGNDFGNFTSEDYGGRDFYNRGGGVSGGMRSSESYRPTYSAARLFDRDDDQRGRDNGQSRGFLARAGDEVASWFGDEDASRRREQDHRGRGPSGYTRSDDRIREDANDHLTHDWGVDASNIVVSVSNGEITLDGTVDSRQAKRRAEDCVEHISGVKHVQNNLRVQERGANTYGSSGSSYGSSQGGSSYGASAGQGTTGSDAASGAKGTASSNSASTGSSGTGSTGTGASTTSGIGSSAVAGVGSASTTRSSDKTD